MLMLLYRSKPKLQPQNLLVVLIAYVVTPLLINLLMLRFCLCFYNCRYCEVNVKGKFVPFHTLQYCSTLFMNVVKFVVSVIVCCYNC